MTLTLPTPSLVVLIGASGSGKSGFAARHFLPTEVVSSDRCRGLVSDDDNDQGATGDAFELLHFIVGKRLERGRLTVVDATNVQPEARRSLLRLAREHDTMAVAIVLDVPESLCHERNRARPDRDFGPHVVRNQLRQLRRGLKGLKREGFRYQYTLRGPEEIEAARIERQRLWNDLRDDHGPFDIIGDVHGCCDELEQLLERLGYRISPGGNALYPGTWRSPEGRRALFLGDLVDRGPRSLAVLGLVQAMVIAGQALCLPGNHDVKFAAALKGRNVKVRHGLATSLAEIEALPEDLRETASAEIVGFIDRLVSHYLLDDGKLVVAHAGMKERLQGRASGRVRAFALYGETSGETDESGLPVRHDWAAEYRGPALVVYGHTPVPEPLWLNNTVNIDTGCVFGGALSALRYPEREILAVPAARSYAEPMRPFRSEAEPALTPQQRSDDTLDIEDVLGKRIISTRLRRTVTLREEQTAAALETASRFVVDPKWLIHLPPTMAAPSTSAREGLLEHPDETFAYYRREGVERVVCQEKHMGSRALALICRDEDTARRRFGVLDGSTGRIYTRSGRPFFSAPSREGALLGRLRTALDDSEFWQALGSDWVLLDAELMPWSEKAQALLREQYAAVGAAAQAALPPALSALERAAARGLEVADLHSELSERLGAVTSYREAYRRYCWPVTGVNDLRFAPFHLLASEGAVHSDKGHDWHLATLARHLTSGADPVLTTTESREVDLADEAEVAAAIAWWEHLTERGGEGMVVKPKSFVARGRRGLAQPAVKVRGREYLRIIYGPEYTRPHNLERLRSRNVGAKRSLALREFALGIEALERFVNREPLRRVHECVFGVLALESEARGGSGRGGGVDPRL